MFCAEIPRDNSMSALCTAANSEDAAEIISACH